MGIRKCAFSVVILFYQSKHHDFGRIFFQRPPNLFQNILIHGVIRIHKPDVRSAGFFHSRIACLTQPYIFFQMEHSDPLVFLGFPVCDLTASVFRTVVHNNDLPVTFRLRLNAADRLFDIGFHAVSRHHDAKIRFSGHIADFSFYFSKSPAIIRSIFR